MSDEERARFRELRTRELNRESLTGSETAELADFYALLEREETALLGPSIERTKAEADMLAQANAELRGLLEREKSFAHRLEVMLSEIDTERQVLRAERERLARVLEHAA